MTLREESVAVALKWQEQFGEAPHVTSAVAEYDAAKLVGMLEDDYGVYMNGRTVVSEGADFEYKGRLYQVKANRPSGRKGSAVTLVPRARSYEWHILIWILYDREYNIVEAWQWDVCDYRARFYSLKRLSPKDMRQEICLKGPILTQ